MMIPPNVFHKGWPFVFAIHFRKKFLGLPHVTIAMGSTDQELVELEKSFSREIADQLPLVITADEV